MEPRQEHSKWEEAEDEEEQEMGLRVRRSKSRHGDANTTSAPVSFTDGSGTTSVSSTPSSPADDHGVESGCLNGERGKEPCPNNHQPNVDKEDRDADVGSADSPGSGQDGELVRLHSSVYHDEQQEGLWKCRHCSWTYRVRNPETSIQKSKEHLDTFIQLALCTGLTDGVSDMELCGVECCVDENLDLEVKQFGTSNEMAAKANYHFEENLGDKSFPVLNSSTLEELYEGKGATLCFEGKTGIDVDVDVIEESEKEVTELDVERLLEKQDTHDLYCPNCNSCITRRVILRRKKRKVRKLQNKVNRGRLHTIVPSDLDGSPTPAPGDHDSEREPGICGFGCLECFSFFIPTGNGLQFLRFSRDDMDSDNVLNSQSIAGAKTSCFPFFKSDKRDKATVEDGVAGQLNSSSCKTPDEPAGDASKTPDEPAGDASKTPDKPAGDASKLHPSGGLVAEKPDDDVKNSTDHVILTVEPTDWSPQDITSMGGDNLIGSQTLPSADERQEEDHTEGRQLDILKSIVYGGLMESITSLGVVSSAAGAGAATLSILALGLANLIGGLVAIVHNLRELKNDDSERASSRINEQDQYQELLGHTRDFPLHAALAILSFLVFGLIPPVLYGFSFRKSNNRDLKLAVVAGASLLCITLLALGKGHIRKQSYIKTILYYVSIGFMTSGISYIVGDLVEGLFEKLGWFDNGLAALLIMGPESKELRWASY